MILCISVVSVVMSPLSFLISFVFSLFFLISLAKILSSSFPFSKNELLVLLIFKIVFLGPVSFISALISIISFLLQNLGVICSYLFSS